MTKARMRSITLVVAAGCLTSAACAAPAPPVAPIELGSPAAAASSAPAPAPPAATADGTYGVTAWEAATLRFAVTGRQVVLENLTTAAGWQQVRDVRRPEEVVLGFQQGETIVQLDAEVDDGAFETDVDVTAPAVPARTTYRVGEAGSVTVDVAPGGITLVGQEAAPGWVATVDERELARGEVKVRFLDDAAGRSVQFDAEVERGLLEVDIDSRSGPGYVRPGTGR